MPACRSFSLVLTEDPPVLNKKCTTEEGVSLCKDLCTPESTYRTVIILETLDWTCVAFHPHVERVRSYSPVTCIGRANPDVDTRFLTCRREEVCEFLLFSVLGFYC